MGTSPKKLGVKDIPVVIFCGGKGTRLKEETEIVPKPMVRIGDRPILWHILKIYHAQGFRKFILLLGYKGEKIKEYVSNYGLYATDFTHTHGKSASKITFHGRPAEDWEITCVDTGLETETGGRLQKISHLITAPVFMLTYGDGVADVDLHALLSEHASKRKLVTMTAVPPPARFGELVFKDGELVGFAEKPARKEGRLPERMINGGFFVVDSRILSELPKRDDLNFEKDMLTKFVREGKLGARPHMGFWQCMDTIRDMELLNELWKSGKAAWNVWA